MRLPAIALELLLAVGASLSLAACVTADGSDDGIESPRGPLGKADAPGSCVAEDGGDLCGGQSEGACWCDDLCADYGDCCGDKQPVCDGVETGPTLCMSDATCGDGQVCDHSQCLSNCPPGNFCPAVCWGACADEPTPPPPPPLVDTCEGACGGKSAGACWCDDLCAQYGDCCDDYDAACTEPVATCDDIVEDFLAETADIRSCTAADECGQVLSGTSCGCTRNWVARTDADLSTWEGLRQTANDQGCSIPGGISTCDCPPADGFACVEGTCTWNYQ